MVADIFIPEGYTITASPYAVHHATGQFGGHENEFIPERLLHLSYLEKVIMDTQVTTTST